MNENHCKVIFLTCLGIIFLTHQSEAAHTLTRNEKLDFKEVEERLLTEEVIVTQSFRDFLRKNKSQNSLPHHPMQHVTLKSGLKALFKKVTSKNYHYGEVVAYRLSQTLGLSLVPPTVYRVINGVEGSLQLYLEATDLKDLAFRTEVYKTLDPEMLSNSRIFAYLAGRVDAQGRNEIVVKKEGTFALFLIDNSSICHRSHMIYGGPIFVCKSDNFNVPTEQGESFPLERVQTLEKEPLESVFKHFMGPKRLKRFNQKKSISFVVWNHGLYIQSHAHMPNRFSPIIYQSTLQALKELTALTLFELWYEYHERFPDYAKDLILKTLERRDQVVTYFEARPEAIISTTLS